MALLPHGKSPATDFAYIIFAKHISFNFVECPEFKLWWQTYIKDNAPPTRRALATTHLDSVFKVVTEDVKKTVASIKYLALTTDGWTGLSTSYWSLTAQGLDSDFKMHHFRLGCRPIFAPVHSADVIAVELKETLKVFGISEDKVASVVTDEGGAAPLIASHFPAAEEIHCVAHLLNTTLRNAFAEFCTEKPIADLFLMACRDLASSSNHSTQFREQLAVNQLATTEPVKTLKQSVSTRWNSILHNIKSCLESKHSIARFCAANRKLKFSKVINKDSERCWAFLAGIRRVLELFEKMTVDVSAEDQITADRSVYAYLALKAGLDDKGLFDIPELAGYEENILIAEMRELCQSCAVIVAKHLTAKLAIFTEAEKMAFSLNPKHRLIPNPPEGVAKMWNALLEEGYSLLESTEMPKSTDNLAVIESPETESQKDPLEAIQRLLPATTVTDDYHAEVARFKAEAPPPKTTTVDVWWKGRLNLYPLLADLALRYLCTPASQAASERDFSQMRLMCTHLRQSLDPWKAFKLSVVGPFIRSHRGDKSARRTTEQQAAKAQRLANSSETRREGLKRRFSSISPNPVPSPMLDLLDEPAFVDGLKGGNGECESDHEFQDPEDESPEDYFIDAADNDFLTLQPVAQIPKLQNATTPSRSDRVTCTITQSVGNRFGYIAEFTNLKNRALPSVEYIFGAASALIKNWQKVTYENGEYWKFEATEAAIKRLKSGKTILREIGEYYTVDI
jgi:hypothetical protein